VGSITFDGVGNIDFWATLKENRIGKAGKESPSRKPRDYNSLSPKGPQLGCEAQAPKRESEARNLLKKGERKKEDMGNPGARRAGTPPRLFEEEHNETVRGN